MLTRSILLATALLALAGCNRNKPEAPPADSGVSVTLNSDKAAKDSGRVEITLPGGLQARVDVPDGMAKKAKFDIRGVGLYPGARIGGIKVDAGKSDSGSKAVVTIGFTAAADAAAVADWYQQQFDARKVPVKRDGETLTGKTSDGDDFTLAITQGADGASGVLSIRDSE